MAFVTGDRVKETTTTTGTGTITLAGAATGFRAFSAVAVNGDVLYYCIVGGAEWEVGMGTWQTGSLLARTAGNVLSGSSGAGVLVNFSAGTKDVFITAPASEIVQQDDTGTFHMPVITIEPTKTAGFAHVYAKDVANRGLLKVMGPSGLDSPLQPMLAMNKIAYWNPPGNATTVPGVFGLTAPTAQGTATARNVATTNILTRMKRLAYVSAATAGSLCGQYIANAQFTIGDGTALGGFFLGARFGVADAAAVSGARMFCGMSSSVAAATNVEPSTLTNSIGMAQLSTDNTQWYIVYGGSAAQTAIPLGTGLGAPTLNNTAWELILFASASSNNSIGYHVTNLGSGVAVSGTLTAATPGTQLPASTTLLTYRNWRCNNATALAVAVDVCSVYIETDY